jgi:hypothetical protein
LSECNHEEAETRIVVHILHALEHGSKTVQVRTVDTDVVIILAGAFCELIKIQRSQALPVFHALSGCDTTPAFRGKGMKSVWQALGHLACHPFETINSDTDHYKKLERMTVILYEQFSEVC